MPRTYEYPRPALTVDAVVFGLDGGELKVLLIERGLEPFKGQWALPGGFVQEGETLDRAVSRELAEEAGVQGVFMEQLYTFGAVDRDPRERVVSVAYYALVNLADHTTRASTDAVDARWFPAATPPPLAFDHADILQMALDRLRGKVRWQPVGFELLPEKFTLTQLQQLYESVLGTSLDKRNFRKKVLGFDFLVPLDETRRDGPHRPAQLFRFDHGRYTSLQRKGFHFEL
ncbi:MAG: 8-oxo-dGTP diphosphatase [Verrucomicrobiales bacterium]|nr:8-oxo-dGTP diphosphatase [Verrucomicrobiales bacterium]